MVFECAPDADSIVIDVVEAVATVAGVDPREFQPRLHDVVDPDALARIVASGGAGTRVSFDLDCYRVTVDGAGKIVVEEA